VGGTGNGHEGTGNGHEGNGNGGEELRGGHFDFLQFKFSFIG